MPRKHELSETVSPAPFFKIKIGCSNRKFYDEKSHIYNVGESIGIESQDGYIEEVCDYEGDLEKMIISSNSRSIKFIQAILSSYGLDSIQEGMSLQVSIW